VTRGRRIALLVAVTLVALPAGVILALQVALARGVFTDRVDAALERALARAVSHDAIAIRVSLRPRITLTGARIANVEGGSQPEFARIGRLEVTLAMAPLLTGRVDLASLRLSDAEIILERGADGRPNWIFGAGGGTGGGIAIDEIRIESSRLLIPSGPVREVTIASLDLERDGPGEPLAMRGRIALDGEALDITARIGPEADEILPIDAAIRGRGLRLALRGAVPRATANPGWSLRLEAAASRDAAQRLAARAGHPIPSLAIEHLAARLGPGEPWPSVSDLTLRLSPFSASAWLPGLEITRAELRAGDLGLPAMLSVQGRRADADIGLTASLPSPRRLLEAATNEPLPVEALLTAGRARLAVSGAIAPGIPIGEAVLAARLAAPDLAALGPLFGTPLPRLRDIDAEAQLSGLFTRDLRLDRLSLSAAGIEQATGDLAIAFAPRLAVTGALAARHLDLDRLAGSSAAARSRASVRAIPEITLPLATLRDFDARVSLAATSLVMAGISWRDANATITLEQGRLLAEPLAATMPGGALAGRLLVESAADPPRIVMRIDSRGRGLDLAAMRRAFGVPLGFDGQAELALDLAARGATTRALAATLTGEVGIAMVGGRFTGATALRIGPELARALLPGGTPADGLALRCLAIRLTAEDGLARSEALLMEGGFGRIDGTLALNLREETLAARLLPDIRVMGVTVRAPVTVGGTLAQPRLGVEPGAAVARVIGDTVANRLWRSSTIEYLRGAAGNAPPGGDCAGALRLARLGRSGPVPESAPAPIPLVPRELQGTAQDVVRGIGGLLGGRRR
jgi:AsmA protein